MHELLINGLFVFLNENLEVDDDVSKKIVFNFKELKHSLEIIDDLKTLTGKIYVNIF